LRSEQGRPLSPERLGTLLGLSGATVRRWEDGQAQPTPTDLVRIGEALQLTPVEQAFLAGAFLSDRTETAPEDDVFDGLLANLMSTENPWEVLDSLLFPRSRSSYLASVIGVKALSVSFSHPIPSLLAKWDDATSDQARDEVEPILRQWIRDFWLASARFCGAPAYRRVLGEFSALPGFIERWLGMALRGEHVGLPPYGLSLMRDYGDAGVFRVVPMQVSLPATYFVLEYQPFDARAKRNLRTIKERLRPFPVKNPLTHWSQEQQTGLLQEPGSRPDQSLPMVRAGSLA
jgi:transcriptional regulator with XRE-family HTH domain